MRPYCLRPEASNFIKYILKGFLPQSNKNIKQRSDDLIVVFRKGQPVYLSKSREDAVSMLRHLLKN